MAGSVSVGKWILLFYVGESETVNVKKQIEEMKMKTFREYMTYKNDHAKAEAKS